MGYARSDIPLDDFRKRISSKIKVTSDEDKQSLDRFLSLCTYFTGKYDDLESFERLDTYLRNVELPVAGFKHRLFYMALPPSVFIPASSGLKKKVYSRNGSNRLIVEKPFGKDFDSSKVLSKALAEHWKEEEVMFN